MVRFVRISVVALLVLLFIGVNSWAQDSASVRPNPWKFTGDAALTFNQVALYHWVPGGVNSISGQASLFLRLLYKQDRQLWDNTLDMGYGLTKQAEDPLIKNLDRILFNSQYGYEVTKSLYMSALLSMQTQFAPGYKDNKNTVKISDAFSPYYLSLAVGVDYRPDSHFSLFFSPLSGRLTYVRSQMLADLGAFGVKAATYDATTKAMLTPGEHVRWELGANLKAEYINRFFKDQLGLKTTLQLFSNYLDKPQNVDVNFDLLLDYKLLSFLTATAQITLVYDDDQKITNEAGQQVASLQVRQMFGLGLAYHF